MISVEEQFYLDIDWFFIDGNVISFVASAGGRLPGAILKSGDNIQLLSSFFRALPIITDVTINPNLSEIMPSREINENYLSDFIFIAKRGLYAFDKTRLNDFNDDRYHLVASPQKALTIQDLPLEISDIIAKTSGCDQMRSGFNSLSIF